MDVCLLWVLCVVRKRSLRRADHSSRGVLPTVVRRCVWSRKPQEWGGHDPRWVGATQKNNIYIYTHNYKEALLTEGKSHKTGRKAISNRDIRSSGILCSLDWWIVTDVSEQSVGTIFKDQAAWHLKMGPTDYPETSVNNYRSKLRTFQYRQDIICTAGEAQKSRNFNCLMTYSFCKSQRWVHLPWIVIIYLFLLY